MNSYADAAKFALENLNLDKAGPFWVRAMGC